MDHTSSCPLHRRAVAVACGSAFAALAVSGFAQTATEEPRGTIRVEVTGSNIKRVDAESGLPVQVITRQQMLDGGMQTMQDLLERVSANQSFGGSNEALGVGSTFGVGNGTFGYSSASLRGLGAERTLVLLNGKRLAPYAIGNGQGVDVSAIPASALKRVEILKDGASAIYGTDAIGGVVNFVLRTDFTGAELYANYYGTEQGGGNSWRVNGTVGYGDLTKDRYNVFLSADYLRQDPLEASAREATRTGYRPDLGINGTNGYSFPANILQPGGFGTALRNPTIPFPGGATAASCASPLSFPTREQPYQCRFDQYGQADAIPEAEKVNAFGRIAWQIDADTQFFAEGSYYRGVFTERIAGFPIVADAAGNPYTLAPTSPHYPTDFVKSLPRGNPNLPVQVRYMSTDLGPLTNQGTSEQWRAVAGLQGTWQEWDYSLVANATANKQSVENVSGAFWEPLFTPLFKSGQVNPFGHNTDAVVQQLKAAEVTHYTFNDNRASDYGGGLKVSRSFGALPGGPLALALGAEGRREDLDISFNESNRYLLSYSGDPTAIGANRTVYALFGEVNVPVTPTFEATLAARYDHYSDFGSTTNPKVALRWQPRKDILVRASWGTGFRAPTLSDVYQPAYYWGPYVIPEDDPWRCPTTHSPDDCQANFRLYTGGNPELRPEKSTQWGAGVVFEPLAGLSISADYYSVEIDDVIDGLLAWMIFDNFDYYAPTYVIRKPRTAEDIALGLPGVIDHIVNPPINYGSLKTSGVDFDLRFRMPAVAAGQFTLGFTGTYVIDYAREHNDSTQYPAGAGQNAQGSFGAVSRWRHYATLGWSYGPWGATLAQNFQNGYSEPCRATDPSGCATRRVGSYSVWDLQGRYTGFKDVTLSLGVRNLMDQAPPVSAVGGTWQKGMDVSYGDARGRIFYGSIRYAFK